MNNILYFVSPINKSQGESNQKMGTNGTRSAKLKILLRTIGTNDYMVATVCSNREARRALKILKPESLVRIIMGSDEKESFRFLSDTPIIHASQLEVINFYKTENV